MILGTWDRSIPPILGSLAFLQLNQVSWVSLSSRVEPNQPHHLSLTQSHLSFLLLLWVSVFFRFFNRFCCFFASSSRVPYSIILQSELTYLLTHDSSFQNLPLLFVSLALDSMSLSIFWFFYSFFESSSVLWLLQLFLTFPSKASFDSSTASAASAWVFSSSYHRLSFVSTSFAFSSKSFASSSKSSWTLLIPSFFSFASVFKASDLWGWSQRGCSVHMIIYVLNLFSLFISRPFWGWTWG